MRSKTVTLANYYRWMAAGLAARHVLAVDALSDEEANDLAANVGYAWERGNFARSQQTADAVRDCLRRMCEGGEEN